ncbi:VOC family protein [Bacillus coahuilensis]|uniref:VOC family protein n=1 Tax=Bacillus coahuilensis TaxID=408580 RepID=UPI0002EA9E71
MGFHDEGSTYVAHVTIKVANLARSLTFYQEIIGFNVLEETERTAVLTADGRTPLLSLQVPIQAEEKKERTTGLYHFALLLPERKDLGDFIYHLAEYGIEIGAADHLVSEAIYLSDPDGNGIELYRDRPSTDWRWEGKSICSHGNGPAPL